MTGINCSAGEIANGWQAVPLARDPASDSQELGDDAGMTHLGCPQALGDSGTRTRLRGWSLLLSLYETTTGLERILRKRILSGIPSPALFCSIFCLAVTQVPGQSIWVLIRDAQELVSGGASFEACSVLAPVHLSLCPSRYFNT